MKITVQISEKELKEIQFYVGERKKGPALQKLISEALLLKKRRAFLDKVVNGEWSVDFGDHVNNQEDRSVWPQ